MSVDRKNPPSPSTGSNPTAAAPVVKTEAKPKVELTPEVDPVDAEREVIIILEDSPPNRNIMKNIILKLGYSVLVGDTGVLGVQYLKRCEDENLKLVAIFSDIMMPEMDGLAFLDKVRKSPKFSKIPVVLVTAAADKYNVLEAKRLGISGYVLKPIEMEFIKIKLRELFPNKAFPPSRPVKKLG